MAESESVSSDFSSDEETEMKAIATKINLQAFLPDIVENGQVSFLSLSLLTVSYTELSSGLQV